MSTTQFISRPTKRDTTKPQECEILEILPSRAATPRVNIATGSQGNPGTSRSNFAKEYQPQTGRISDLPGSVSSNSFASAESNTTTTQQRVLVISSTYPMHAADDAVPWMREILQQMSERGHQITVLAPAFKGLQSHTLDGIEVRRFRYAPASIERLAHEQGTANSDMQLLAIPYIIFGCITAAWLVLTRKFDVVHVHSPYLNGLLGQVARFFSGAPLVIMSHATEMQPARRKNWAGLLLKQSLRAADMLISDSSDTARLVTKLSQRKCHILPCGTKVSAANSNQPKNKVAQVLFSGQLTECKGLEYLLRAAPRILEKHPAQFIIAGNGDQRSKLEALSQKLGISKSVKFIGLVSDAQLGNEFANCDIWVNPAIVNSRGEAEGLSLGVIEAYNYQKPVVATRVAGNSDAVIDGVTGRLVPQKDSVALADAIRELLADPVKRQRMGRNGFYFAQKTFSRNRIVTDLESLYEEVIFESVHATCSLDVQKAFQSLHVLPSVYKNSGNATHYNPIVSTTLT